MVVRGVYCMHCTNSRRELIHIKATLISTHFMNCILVCLYSVQTHLRINATGNYTYPPIDLNVSGGRVNRYLAHLGATNVFR